jgi:3-phenylpropionate/trans-cinnamate dioxygenase ferredoxin reductase subunit
MLLGASIVEAHGAGGVERVTLSDGHTVPCDHVVVGVGVDPDVRWLGGGGLGPVGAEGQTRMAGVFAAGDVTGGGHWESAARQGAAAARAMLGLEPLKTAPDGFWSDLYDTRVQYVGHAPTADGTTIDGDPAARDFRVTFTREGRAVGVLLVGRPHELPDARALLAA